jgi:DNA-binding MurR/RpiR family transcriptional regulator
MSEEMFARIPHSCALKIQAGYPNLKSAERRAVDFLMANAERIADLNIVDFASMAECSEATAVRMAKRLGYEGYIELRRSFDLHRDAEPEGVYPEIDSKDPLPTMLEKVFNSSMSSLADTLRTLDLGQFTRAVDALVGSGQILFCGIGDGGVVARESYLRWLKVGHTAYESPDADEQLFFTTRLGPGDVMLAFSHSGRSRTVNNAAKLSRKRGATVIAVTNYPVSPLVKTSDIILQTAVFATFANFEVIAKRLAQLCIVESLFIGFLQKMGKPYLKRMLAYEESVKPNKV